MSWFTEEWDVFVAFLARVGSVVFGFIGPLADSIAKNGGAVLVQIAYDAVVAAETAGGGASEKFAAAQATIISELTTKGLPVVMNAVNGALEAAVAKLKAA